MARGRIASCLNYEVWNMGERRGLLEIGLTFEGRDRAISVLHPI